MITRVVLWTPIIVSAMSERWQNTNMPSLTVVMAQGKNCFSKAGSPMCGDRDAWVVSF